MRKKMYLSEMLGMQVELPSGLGDDREADDASPRPGNDRDAGDASLRPGRCWGCR